MPNAVPVSAQRATNVMEHVWTLTEAEPIGDAVTLPAHGNRTVHIHGDEYAASTVKIQGSNDGTNWLDLHDPQGNAISKTANWIGVVAENPLYVRAHSSGGTDLDVVVRIVSQRGAY